MFGSFAPPATIFASSPVRSTISLLKNFGNLTFYKNYVNSLSVDADYSVGSGTGTYTASRGASNPATYIDSSGVVQTTTTSNIPRLCGGYYNSTGFVLRPGLMIESAATNLVPKSNTHNDASWTASNVTVTDSTGITSPDGTASSTFTSTAGNGTVLLASAVTAVVYSVWIQRKTGTGNIDITANGGTNWTTQTLVAGQWARFNISAASASQTCGIRIVTSGDAIYVYGAQFESGAFENTNPSSYIPTTSVALTRNLDSLSYATASNISANVGTILAKATMTATQPTSIARHFFRENSTGGFKWLRVAIGNAGFQWGTLAEQTSVQTFTAGTSYTLCVTYDGTNVAGYVNGSQTVAPTPSANLTSSAASFYIGSNLGANEFTQGIMSSLAIYSDAKSSGNVAAISTIL